MIWTKAGELKNPRDEHNVVFDGSNFLVFGGSGTKKTEKCTILNNQMTCTEQTPELTNFSIYPELFLVQIDFCKTFP